MHLLAPACTSWPAAECFLFPCLWPPCVLFLLPFRRSASRSSTPHPPLLRSSLTCLTRPCVLVPFPHRMRRRAFTSSVPPCIPSCRCLSLLPFARRFHCLSSVLIHLHSVLPPATLPPAVPPRTTASCSAGYAPVLILGFILTTAGGSPDPNYVVVPLAPSTPASLTALCPVCPLRSP